VIIHEFAHKIDMADGEPSGTPPVADRSQARAFERTAEDTLDMLRSTGARDFRACETGSRTVRVAVSTGWARLLGRRIDPTRMETHEDHDM